MATRALCEPTLGPGEQLVEEAPGGPRLCLAQEASLSVLRLPLFASGFQPDASYCPSLALEVEALALLRAQDWPRVLQCLLYLGGT